MAAPIQHDSKSGKFFIRKELSEAYLGYERPSDTVLDFKTTFVPEVFRGQGIAAELVKAGLEYAKENNLKVVPTCSYVDAYLKRNQDTWGWISASAGSVADDPGLNVCEAPPSSAEHARLGDDNEPCDDGRAGSN